MALLSRDASSPPPPLTHHLLPPPPPKSVAQFHDFCGDTLTQPIEGHLWQHGTSLFALKTPLPSVASLRVASSGFYLGDVGAHGFVPSQAFAMGLTTRQTHKFISFEQSDHRVNRYLKGESFTVDAPNGWHLVCICNHPLGWGKVVNGQLKNKYEKSWMINK